jgi:transcriptional regulator with XRE-family HTH domain
MSAFLVPTRFVSPELKILLRDFRRYCDSLPHGRKKDIAELLGLTPSGLWNITRGGQHPTGDQVLKILQLLGRLK